MAPQHKFKNNKETSSTERIDFDDAVKEARQILAKGEEDQWRLAELAGQVETSYGEKKLQQFAKAIGIAPCTVARMRSVWRAWQNDKNEGPAPKSFAVAQALQGHPERQKLISENPGMTRAKARRLMADYNRSRKGDGDGTVTATTDASENSAANSNDNNETKADLSSGLVKANKAVGLAQDIAKALDDPNYEVTKELVVRCQLAAEEWTKTLRLVEQRTLPELPDAPPVSPAELSEAA
jgi:hypothetical protein